MNAEPATSNKDDCAHGTLGGTELSSRAMASQAAKAGQYVREFVVEGSVPRNLATKVANLDCPYERNPAHGEGVRHLGIEHSGENRSCSDVSDNIARKTDRERRGN